MKLIIAGSRSLVGMVSLIDWAINRVGWKPTLIISGHAKGVDMAGESWAEQSGIPIKRYIPDWDTHGKKAGFLRNSDMVRDGDGLLAIQYGQSKGTQHTIDLAHQYGLPTLVIRLDVNV